MDSVDCPGHPSERTPRTFRRFSHCDEFATVDSVHAPSVCA